MEIRPLAEEERKSASLRNEWRKMVPDMRQSRRKL